MGGFPAPKETGQSIQDVIWFIDCFPPVRYCILITNFILHPAMLRANRDLIMQSNKEEKKKDMCSFGFLEISAMSIYQDTLL